MFCRSCGAGADRSHRFCARCGSALTTAPSSQQAQVPPAAPVPVRYPEEKSVGLALFLNFLWPGAGHLYAGVRTGLGITFCILNAVAFLLALTIIGIIIAFPMWLVMVIWSMIDASKLVPERNRQLGYLTADDVIASRQTTGVQNGSQAPPGPASGATDT